MPQQCQNSSAKHHLWLHSADGVKKESWLLSEQRNRDDLVLQAEMEVQPTWLKNCQTLAEHNEMSGTNPRGELLSVWGDTGEQTQVEWESHNCFKINWSTYFVYYKCLFKEKEKKNIFE